MARTKQTARKLPPKELHKKRKDNNWKEELAEKKRKINLSPQIFPCDLTIITTTSGDDDSNNYSSQVESSQMTCPNLDCKLNEHVCSERCYAWLPQVNWENYAKYEYPVIHALYGNYSSNTIFATTFEPIDVELVQHILDQVESKQDEFSARVFKVEMNSRGSIDNNQIIQSVTYEYRKCGIQCYYTRSKEFEREVVMIFMDKEKYLCFGHYYNSPYCVIPYVDGGADSESINLCEDEFVTTTTNVEGHIIETPILIPLPSVLENAKDFLEEILYQGNE